MGAKGGAKDKELVRQTAADLADDLAGLGDAVVSTRAMFGGVGIFADGVMFALVTSDAQPCLRTGDDNVADFEAAGSERFHERMPYHRIPDDVLADHDELRRWATTSLAVARAAKK